MASPPTDADLTEAVREHLGEVFDLSTVTMNTVRAALEARLGCDLQDRRDVLKQALTEYVESMVEPEEELLAGGAAHGSDDEGADGADEVEEEDEEEEETGEGGSRGTRNRGGGTG